MKYFSRSDTQISCVTAAISITSLSVNMRIVVLWEMTNRSIDTRRDFVFLKDPVVTDVFPRRSLYS